MKHWTFNTGQHFSKVKAKFHYTGPTGPDRTLSETRADPTEFLGDPGRKKVRAGPCGSGRARVVEFSYYRQQFGAFLFATYRTRLVCVTAISCLDTVSREPK